MKESREELAEEIKRGKVGGKDRVKRKRRKKEEKEEEITVKKIKIEIDDRV